MLWDKLFKLVLKSTALVQRQIYKGFIAFVQNVQVVKSLHNCLVGLNSFSRFVMCCVSHCFLKDLIDCLAPLFVYKFEVCPYTMHLSYASVQNPHTLSHSAFRKHCSPLFPTIALWIATHPCVSYWWRGVFLFFSFLKFWIEGEKRDERSSVMNRTMGEFGQR